MRGPREFTLGREALQTLSRQTRYVQRLPRNQRPHRRRSPSRAASAATFAIGTLTAKLNAGGSAGFNFTLGGTGSGSDTCYDYLLCVGDSLASGTKICVAKIAGKWVVIQSVCPC